jgi:hypothetical protein
MADANAAKFGGRPAGFYDKPQGGLMPVKLPKPGVTGEITMVTCCECGVRFGVVNGGPTPCPGCGLAWKGK